MKSSKKRKKRERRASGDGGVYPIVKGGYRGFITVGYDAKTGKRKRKYVRGKTEDEVRAKLRKLLPKSSNRIVSSPERVTTDEWLNRYVDYRAQDVRPRTRESHKFLASKITPILGKVLLHKLTVHQIRDFYKQLVQQHLSPSTRQHIHDLLKGALQDAERVLEGYKSPMYAVDRPTGGRVKDPEVWEPASVVRFLEAVRSHRFYGVFYFTLTQGLRIGEVLGLRWSDLTGNALSIERTVTLDEGKNVVGPPKTERGYRTLYLTDDAMTVLSERRTQQMEERREANRWESSTYIFSTTVGTITSTHNVRRVYYSVFTYLQFVDFVWNTLCCRARWWHLFKPELGIPYIRIHGQRHTYITTVRDRGVDLEVVANRAGQDPKVTASIYSHVTEARKKKAALSAQDLYLPKPTKVEH
jgi:integrase